MIVDFAIARPARWEGLSPEDAIRAGLSPALPPDHHDDVCGAARRLAADARARHRLGASPAARATQWSVASLLSQVLTLFTTPVVYLYLDRQADDSAAAVAEHLGLARADYCWLKTTNG